MCLIFPSDRFAVLGASGMAGSAICRALKEADYGNSKRDGILLAPKRKELNLLDSNSVENWFKNNKPSVVVLAAAKVGGIQANKNYPTEFLLENLKIQSNVIESAWKNGTRRFLFLGSSCCYPKFAKQPIKEDALLEGALEQTNEFYAIAKISGIKLCQALRKQYNFDTISLMPTNIYGPGDNYHLENSHVLPGLIKRFLQAKNLKETVVTCWGSGSPLREFLHVDDLANACLLALRDWDPNERTSPKDNNGNALNHLNVGTGTEISIRDLACIIANEIGYKGEIAWDKSKPDGTPRKRLDVSRMNALGWIPKIPIEEGIHQTIKLYASQNK